MQKGIIPPKPELLEDCSSSLVSAQEISGPSGEMFLQSTPCSQEGTRIRQIFNLTFPSSREFIPASKKFSCELRGSLLGCSSALGSMGKLSYKGEENLENIIVEVHFAKKVLWICLFFPCHYLCEEILEFGIITPAQF